MPHRGKETIVKRSWSGRGGYLASIEFLPLAYREGKMRRRGRQLPGAEHGRKPLRKEGKNAHYICDSVNEVNTSRGENGNVMPRQKMGVWLGWRCGLKNKAVKKRWRIVGESHAPLIGQSAQLDSVYFFLFQLVENYKWNLRTCCPDSLFQETRQDTCQSIMTPVSSTNKAQTVLTAETFTRDLESLGLNTLSFAGPSGCGVS